jgi:hypothetical protein
MEPQGLLPSSQEPATGAYPFLNEYGYSHLSFKMTFNVILSSTSGPSLQR